MYSPLQTPSISLSYYYTSPFFFFHKQDIFASGITFANYSSSCKNITGQVDATSVHVTVCSETENVQTFLHLWHLMHHKEKVISSTFANLHSGHNLHPYISLYPETHCYFVLANADTGIYFWY